MKGILCLAGFLLWGLSVFAQVGNLGAAPSGSGQLWDIQEILERVVELDGEADCEELEAYFAFLFRHPLDINKAKREELEQLHLLTDFQIASLLEYRNSNGHILSAAELALVHGFDAATVSLISRLVRYGNPNSLSDTYFAGRRGRDTLGLCDKLTSSLLVKWWWKKGEENYVGNSSYTQLKYKLEYDNRVQAGFTLEKDAGELLFPQHGALVDFSSFHIMAKDVQLPFGMELSAAVLGDFAIRLGQGLVMWNGFGFGGNSTVQGAYRRGRQVNAYTSSDENDFLRGGAATVKRDFRPGEGIGATLFFSLKDVDARIKDGKYTSLPTDGLHNTESLLLTRKTLGEIIYGASLQYWNHKMKFGINWAGYGYDVHNGRKVQEYNKYQMYDGQWGNLSVDVNALLGRSRVFAELASDYGGNVAFIGGVATRVRRWDFSATLRSYSYRYIAPYSGAYSTISSCSNQTGISFVAQRNIKGVAFSAGGDFTYYPWKRYNVDEASFAAKLWVRGEGETDELMWNVRLQGSGGSHGGGVKMGVKGTVGKKMTGFLQLKARGETVWVLQESWGCALGLETVLECMDGRLRGVLAGRYFNCKDWECRLYMYEYDLPLSFASTMLYGEGFGGYAIVVCKLGRKVQCYLKGDDAGKVKLGLKMRFF